MLCCYDQLFYCLSFVLAVIGLMDEDCANLFIIFFLLIKRCYLPESMHCVTAEKINVRRSGTRDASSCWCAVQCVQTKKQEIKAFGI